MNAQLAARAVGMASSIGSADADCERSDDRQECGGSRRVARQLAEKDHDSSYHEDHGEHRPSRKRTEFVIDPFGQTGLLNRSGQRESSAKENQHRPGGVAQPASRSA